MQDVVAYRRANGAEPYMEFLEEVERAGRRASKAKIEETVRYLAVFGTQALVSAERASQVEGEIWELRPHPYRVMFFHDDERQRYVLLQGFIKQGQKTPPREIENAKRMLEDYYRRR
jgi:phage-related protein